MRITPREKNIGEIFVVGDQAEYYRIPEYQSTRVPEYQSTRVPEYQSTRVPEYQSTRGAIHGRAHIGKICLRT
ncbi:MAG: hypothetical protein FWC99_02180 [Coriobacteriia bacterium]|nr:hypothetical protein [Coriobacteriia bacterium]